MKKHFAVYFVFLLAHHTLTQANISHYWHTVKKEYVRMLDQEESMLMEQLFALMGITRDTWQAYYQTTLIPETVERIEQEYLSYKKHLKKEVSPSIKKTIHAMLVHQMIDPAHVAIFRNDTMPTTLAASSAPGSRKIILVNEYACAPLAPRVFEAFIMHEIQHILHHDSCMNTLAVEGNRAQAVATWKQNYCRFREKRADILACLGSLDHVRAFRDYFRFRSPVTFNSFWRKMRGLCGIHYAQHPHDQARYRYLQRLCYAMERCLPLV